MKTTVTLDTSGMQELWKQQERVAVVETLLDLAKDGLIDLAVTRRIYEDIPRPPLAYRISRLPELGVRQIGSVFRLDVSALDSGDMLGSDRFMDVFDSIAQKLKRQGQSVPDWRDWDHVHGHYLSGRDVFLTWDGRLLQAAIQLKKKVGIVVMKPEEFIADLPVHGTTQ